MGLTVSDQQGVTILSLSGNIMGGPEAGEINEQIHALLDRDKKKLIINLKDVEWMNSSGLGILIGAVTTLKNNGGQLALIHVSERIKNLLRITKLQNVFAVYDSLEKAIEALQ